MRDGVNGRSTSRGVGEWLHLPRPQSPEGSAMAWIITKYLLTAGIVILVSELAKRSDKLGGLVAALPLGHCLDAGLALFGEPEHGEDLQSCLVQRSGTCFLHCRCLSRSRCCYLSSASGRPLSAASSSQWPVSDVSPYCCAGSALSFYDPATADIILMSLNGC